MNKIPWIENGEFKVHNSAQVKKYLCSFLPITDVVIHRSERYITILYRLKYDEDMIYDSDLNSFKINLPSGVFYCLEEKSFEAFAQHVHLSRKTYLDATNARLEILANMKYKELKVGEIEHLHWIYKRLVNVHHEHPNVDYMLKFQEILIELGVPKDHFE